MWLVNLSHGKCEFGKYELLYSCFMVNLRVVNLLFGTNELSRRGVKAPLVFTFCPEGVKIFLETIYLFCLKNNYYI